MQFFHVSIIFVAQELVVPAQIEKKIDFGKPKKLKILTIFSKKGPELISKVPWC